MVFCIAPLSLAEEDDWFIRAEEPPKHKAARGAISSAESWGVGAGPPGFSIPMSQTERKKPPEPDYLVSKVIWGEEATFTDTTGKTLPLADWNMSPTDLRTLVKEGLAVGGQPYHWSNTNLGTFSYDPRTLPCLVISGVRTIRMHDGQIKALREYVLRGGMLIVDSIYGSPHFYESSKRVMQRMFPEEAVRVLPSDHPLFHVFHDIDEVTYPEEPERKKPYIEAIYVGSRIGILISKYGLGTGWEGKQNVFPLLKKKGLKPLYYDIESSRRIAANICGYIVGYADAGAVEGTPEMYGLPDQKTPSDEFVFAQIKHDGAWNVHPNAASTLLNRLRSHSSIRVNLKRVVVDPDVDNLRRYPCLYLTGMDTFKFTPKAISALRRYVEGGGRIVVNNGLGMATFHQAVLAELQKIVPDSPLAQLPADHEIFRSLFTIEQVAYTPTLQKNEPELNGRPVLFGAKVDDDYRIIYSPYDMEAGWLNSFYPMMKGYQNESALQMGMNLITYVMTH